MELREVLNRHLCYFGSLSDFPPIFFGQLEDGILA